MLGFLKGLMNTKSTVNSYTDYEDDEEEYMSDEEEAELAGYGYDDSYYREMEERRRNNPTGEYYDPDIDE